MNYCAGCLHENKCPNKTKNQGECKDKETYEDTGAFKAFDMMMRQNKGIEGPI